MKIEIKNIKYAAFASHETHCFSATVYVDGKRSFTVDNDGRGACNSYYPLNDKRTSASVYDQIIEIDRELEKDILDCDGFSVPNSLDIVIGDLMNKHLELKEARRILKKITYVKNGDMYQLPTSAKPTPENLKKVELFSWWKKEYVLLNTLTLEEVTTYL